MFRKLKANQIPFQRVHQQDLQEAGLSAGVVSLLVNYTVWDLHALNADSFPGHPVC